MQLARQEQYSRWLPLLKWVLAVPHALMMMVLGIVKGALIGVALVSILITGRFPRRLFGPIEGIQRFNLRLHSYLLLTRDEYLPFSFAELPEYGMDYEVPEPDRVPRWRALVQPIIVAPVGIVAQLMMLLAWLVSLAAGISILVRREYPRGLFNIVETALNWQIKVINYGACITTRYPT